MSYTTNNGIISGGSRRTLSMMALQYNSPTNLFNVYTPGSGVQSGGRASNPGIRSALRRRAQLNRGTMEKPHTGRCIGFCNNNDSSKLTIILYLNGTQKQVLLSKNVDTYNPIFNNAKKIKFGNGTEKIFSSYNAYNPPTNLLNLIEVIIPNSVKEIGQLAFINTTSLSSIIIPNSVTTIGFAAFALSSLNSINLPSVTTIKGDAFNNCTALKSVNLPLVTTIEASAFYNCSALNSINLPSVTTIKEDAFVSCTALKSVNLPLVTTIGYCAFDGCSALVTIDLPLVTYIGTNAFCGCCALNLIKLTNDQSLQIKAEAFYNIGSNAKVYLTSTANTHFGNSMYFQTVEANLPIFITY